MHDSYPFYTDTGRLHAYADVPEAIEYGENFIVHREGGRGHALPAQRDRLDQPVRPPHDYGIPLDRRRLADLRQVRNVKMPWAEAKNTKNFLWEKGFQFYCLTPKSRHCVHSSWAVTDWNWLWNDNFGDPYRDDKRLPGIGDVQVPHEPAGRARPRHQRRRLRVRRRQPRRTGPTSARGRTIRSTRSRGCMVRVDLQPGLPAWRHDDEARLLHRDAEDREGARDAARRPRAGRRHRLPGQLPLRLAAEHHPQLDACRCTRPTRCSTRRR